jgi:hypothetical protein
MEDAFKVKTQTADTTNCRIFVWTPKGVGNAAYELKQSNIHLHSIHWSKHPGKAAGLYTCYDGKLDIIDKPYYEKAKNRNYPFVLEPEIGGRIRSPWYDNECRRRANKQEIAQELDLDYLGSSYQYFDPPTVERYIREFAKPYLLEGDLTFTDPMKDVTFTERPDGPLKLWIKLDTDGKPSRSTRYGICADISQGTGASNSTFTVVDRNSRKKIGEYAIATKTPDDFAHIAVAACRFFSDKDGHGAFLNWEANGPGRSFGKKVIEDGYRNIYYRMKNDEKIAPDWSDIPGWYSTGDTKETLLEQYRTALSLKSFENPSEKALRETLEYIYIPGGGIQHIKAKNSVDPSGARESHGDRVNSDALASKMLFEVAEAKPVKPELVYGSIAWLRARRDEARHASANAF